MNNHHFCFANMLKYKKVIWIEKVFKISILYVSFNGFDSTIKPHEIRQFLWLNEGNYDSAMWLFLWPNEKKYDYDIDNWHSKLDITWQRNDSYQLPIRWFNEMTI